MDRSRLGQSDERLIYEVTVLNKHKTFPINLNKNEKKYHISSLGFVTCKWMWFDFLSKVQQGREPIDVDFCSITIDGSSGNDILQRLHTVVKEKEELQQLEIELRAQLIARSEIMEIRNSFDAQMKEHANTNAKFQVLESFLQMFWLLLRALIWFTD